MESGRIFFWRWPVPETLLRPRSVLGVSGALVAALVALEWHFDFDFSLGIAYTIPVALAALVLKRWHILLFAVICAYVRGLFTPQTTLLEQTLRLAMATIAYSGVGMLVSEMGRNRKSALAGMARIQLEQQLRKRAEEQLRLLAESSPAGMLTVDGEGVVLAANQAVAALLGMTPSAFVGRRVGYYLPVLMQALRFHGPRQMRTATSGWARRADGVLFPVMSWFSTYVAGDQRYLAAIVVDVSEEVRDRERENYRHVADAQRLLAGAVSHEIRNLCSAIAVVMANIDRHSAVAASPDWTALTNLTAGLSRIASFELKSHAVGPAPSLPLSTVLDQLRVVIEQDWQDEAAELIMHDPPELPLVAADSHGLLQVFLNLAQNSLRAVGHAGSGALTIHTYQRGSQVIVSFIDTGPGVQDSAGLFHPFRPDADGTGLGLYVSRTLMRSFGGDLVYVATDVGCRFDVQLTTREQADADAALPH